MKFMMLFNEIRRGIFFAMLGWFWLVIAGEHMLIRESNKKVSRVHWCHLICVTIGCILVYAFNVFELIAQLINPFYSNWANRLGNQIAVNHDILSGNICFTSKYLTDYFYCIEWNHCCNLFHHHVLHGLESVCKYQPWYQDFTTTTSEPWKNHQSIQVLDVSNASLRVVHNRQHHDKPSVWFSMEMGRWLWSRVLVRFLLRCLRHVEHPCNRIVGSLCTESEEVAARQSFGIKWEIISFTCLCPWTIIIAIFQGMFNPFNPDSSSEHE